MRGRGLGDQTRPWIRLDGIKIDEREHGDAVKLGDLHTWADLLIDCS